MTHTIQAIRAHTHGSPDVLQLDQIDRPEPAPNEVLIRVHAAGVLPMDCAVRGGLLAGIVPRSLPYIPGTAIAGVIEAVGTEVTDFHVGQAVCGRSPNGAYTEYTVVNAKPPVLNPDTVGYRQTVHIAPLAAKPQRLTFDEAATLSGGAVTAWTSLFEDGGVQAGQRVLIHAAAGGVGLFAAQFARWKGAHVIGTASTANLDYLRSIGVETVIDYTTTRFEDVVQDVDFVLDSIGGDTLTRSMNIVKRGGTLVSIVTEPPADLAQELGIRAIKNATLPTSAHLRQIVEVIDAGHATPLIQQVFPLHEARLAHELCETGHGRGRIVLHIAD